MQSTIKVLIVEDEVVFAMITERTLTRAGYQVLHSVTTGEEAVEHAIREHPDVILMDVRLASGMDGIEAATRILQSYPAKLIFISGYSDGAYEQRALQLNPAGYFIKPVSLQEIRGAIESALNAPA
jgi:DNA-binding NarL/FixJ family response regulator